MSQRIIKRQRAAIEKLKKDNSALKHELALEARGSPPGPRRRHARCRGADPPWGPWGGLRAQEAAVPSVQLQHDLARLRETLEMYSRKARPPPPGSRRPPARVRAGLPHLAPLPEVDQLAGGARARAD